MSSNATNSKPGIRFLYHGHQRPSETLKMLQQTQWFQEFPDEAFQWFSEQTEIIEVENGTTLLEEGGEGDALYLIVQGAIDVFKRDASGLDHKITQLRAGATLGELAMLDGMPYSATGKAGETSTLILIRNSVFENLSQRYPQPFIAFMRKVTRQTSMRLRHTTQALSHYLKRTADLTETLHQALLSGKDRNDFFASMSHDLRTPLTAIIGYSELFEEEVRANDMPAGLEDLKRIRVASRHMLSLINNILEYSRMGSKQVAVDPERIELRPFLDEVMGLMDPLARENENELELEILDGLQDLYGDSLKLRQNLINLMGNACKFTRNGHVGLRVREAPGSEGSMVEFQIWDTGIGMTEEESERLFHSFTQASKDTAKKYGGTGLGLYLCHLYCQMLGGKVWVESMKGMGSVFYMQIPRVFGS